MAVAGFGVGALVVLLVGLAVSGLKLVGFVVGMTTMADLVGLVVTTGVTVCLLVG